MEIIIVLLGWYPIGILGSWVAIGRCRPWSKGERGLALSMALFGPCNLIGALIFRFTDYPNF